MSWLRCLLLRDYFQNGSFVIDWKTGTMQDEIDQYMNFSDALMFDPNVEKSQGESLLFSCGKNAGNFNVLRRALLFKSWKI